MSAQNGSAAPTQQDHSNPDAPAFDKGKGKGKATADPATQDMSMGEEDDSSSEEEIDEVGSRAWLIRRRLANHHFYRIPKLVRSLLPNLIIYLRPVLIVH
jgi:hypothetical protein